LLDTHCWLWLQVTPEQAQYEKLTLVTADEAFRAYEVATQAP
jgi:PIN domain nuclease of toxin-antitoxin system